MDTEYYLWLTILLLAVFGSYALLYMLISELFSLYKNMRAKSWPKTTGKLVLAEVEEVRDDGVTYKPNIKYTYSVDGYDYESTIYSFGMGSLGNKDVSINICSKLNERVDLSVYYMPCNPHIALLEPGLNEFNERSLMWVILFSIVFSPMHLAWLAMYKYLFVWEV